MLKDIGCEYCLVGHSERRHLFGEDNSQVASKFYQSNRVGLNPILCLGETLEQREKNQTIDTISSQIEAVLKYSEKNLPSAMLIAYEPVWAIGSGSPAGLDQIKNVHQYIRSKLHSYEIEARILYGGSVTSRNAGDLLKESEVDGLLIGGASLDAELFAQICKLA
jgi:triosephosphate isomerase